MFYLLYAALVLFPNPGLSFSRRNILTTGIAMTLLDTKTIKNHYISNDYKLGDDVFFVRKKTDLSLKRYIKQLGLHNVPKEEWRECIVAWQKLVEAQWKELSFNYDTLEIPEDWLAEYKEKRKADRANNGYVKIAKGDINYYLANGRKQADVRKVTLPASKLAEYKGILVYGVHEDARKLHELWSDLRNIFGWNYVNSDHVDC